MFLSNYTNCRIIRRNVSSVDFFNLVRLPHILKTVGKLLWMLWMRNMSPDAVSPELLWRAPEFLREPMPSCGTPEGDVYSFGIILQEVVIRGEPYDSAQVLMDIEGSRNIIVVMVIIVIKQMYLYPC